MFQSASFSTNAIKFDPTFAFPSPPPSNIDSDNDLDFDISSFTHCTPDNTSGLFDDVSAFSPIASTSPASTTLISPKSSIADFSAFFSDLNTDREAGAAQALSNHHLERYLHYKALAAKAEIDARNQGTQEFDALLATHSMGEGKTAYPVYQDDTLLYQSQQYLGQPSWNTSLPTYQPQQWAAMAHAQANMHMQAHDAVMVQQKIQQDNLASVNQFLFNTCQSSNVSENNAWSRQSLPPTTMSVSFPPTPSYNEASHNASRPLINGIPTVNLKGNAALSVTSATECRNVADSDVEASESGRISILQFPIFMAGDEVMFQGKHLTIRRNVTSVMFAVGGLQGPSTLR